jgi:cytochrome c556
MECRLKVFSRKFVVSSVALGASLAAILWGEQGFSAQTASAKPVAAKAASALPSLGRAAGAEALRARRDKMKELGGDYKAIVDELRKRKPSLDVIQPSAQDVADRSALLTGWFPKGSGPETGMKTGAKPEIWNHLDDFNALGKAASVSAMKLKAAADAGDLNAIRQQVDETGNACKSCHDKYRNKVDE